MVKRREVSNIKEKSNQYDAIEINKWDLHQNVYIKRSRFLQTCEWFDYCLRIVETLAVLAF